MATKDEWAAMDAINKHFTFRERTAFLVGYRTAEASGREKERAENAKMRAVMEAAKALVAGINRCSKKWDACFIMAAIHGCELESGYHIGAELKAAEDALAAIERGEP